MLRRLYAVCGWGMVALGTVHMFATLRFPALTTSVLWFFSGGMSIALTGSLNLLNRAYGSSAPGLRWVCAAANILSLAFGIVFGVVNRASFVAFAFVLGLTGGAAVLGPIVIRDAMRSTDRLEKRDAAAGSRQ